MLVRGAAVDWKRYHTGAPRRRVALPGYPFRGERYWVGAMPQAVSAEVAPVAATVDAPDAADASDALRPGLRSIVENACGQPVGAAQDATRFDSGLDSLSLTQLALAGAPLCREAAARRLMQDLDSIDRLVAQIAPERAADPAPAVASNTRCRTRCR